MQQSFFTNRNGVTTFTASALPGMRLYNGRVPRQRFMTAATRGDWRAEIEGTGSRSSNGNGSGSNEISIAAERSSSTTTNTAVSTATLQPPPSASPSVPSASSVSPSPWSQPRAEAAAAPRRPKAPQAATPAAAASEAAASAAEKSASNTAAAGEPPSLPTFDFVESLASPKNQATAFTALASISAILATVVIVEPEAVLHVGLPKAVISELDITFLRIVGVTLAASAAVEYSLKHAAESQLLKSATYQRLMAGCAVKAAGFLAVLVVNTPATFRLWNPLVWLAYLGTAVAGGAINLSVLSHTSGKGLAAPPLDVTIPQNPTSWGYTTCIALYLLTVLACFAPETLFTGDGYSDVTPLLKGIWAPGFWLAAVMSYVLKDASDRDRLGASTFKNLNLGLAALEYGYSIIFGSAILSDQADIDLPALSNLGGALLIATFALYTYATAKK